MIALYRGISVASRLIRWYTRGPYSHAAWIDPDTGACYEAWTSGVRKELTYESNHTPGTPVDFFATPATREQSLAIRQFLQDNLGKPYDWPAIFKFVTRRPEAAADQERWDCSEIILSACLSAALPLLARVEPYKVSPSMLSWSPLLVHVRSAICGTPERPGQIFEPNGTPADPIVDGHLAGVCDLRATRVPAPPTDWIPHHARTCP